MRANRLIPMILSGIMPVLGLAVTPSPIISPAGLEQGQVYAGSSASYTYVANQGYRMSLGTRLSTFGVNLNSVDWTTYTHLQVTLTNNKPTATMVEIAFDSGTSGWAYSDFLIAGNATRTVSIPLQRQTVGGKLILPFVSPSANQATMYGSITKNNMRVVRVWNVLKNEAQDLTLNDMSAVALPNDSTALVDQYGQRNTAFTGRILDDTQLSAQWTADNLLSGILPYSSDAYGGVAGTASGAGTGKWRTVKQNGRWYIITPSGNRFFSTGIVNVGVGAQSYVQGRESLFGPGALPPNSGTMAQAWFNDVNPETGQPEPAFSFYRANLIRKYGSNWSNVADDVIVRRLRSWGFNTVGPSSWSALYSSTQGIANMQETAITGNFQVIPTPGGSFAMPDPFDPAWATAVANKLGPLVAQLNLNPYNAGLFVDNELPWGRHWQEANYRYDLAYNVLSAPANQPAKQRFYRNLTMQYRTIQKLNQAWGTGYSSWTALLNNTNFRPTNPNTKLRADMETFINYLATQYFGTIKSRLTALNYKGLYLGCRFAYVTPEVISAAARFCDVLSFNCYDTIPSQWRSDFKNVDKPVMVSEFAFTASDRGRQAASPCGATEADRIAGFNRYMDDLWSWPNLVGYHWYKWEDDPITGRLWDNANHALGMVSIADIPYPEMVAAATQANSQFNQRLLTP